MIQFYKILFFNTTILGTLITISSYSWFSMWMGLEINLLSIIPLMTSDKNIFSSESALKYFLTQAMASTILLFSMITMLYNNEWMFMNNFQFLMINSAIMIKMGAAPFHFWFPEVMDGLNWNISLMILTWQKLAPMIIFSYIYLNYLTLWIVIISTMLSGIMNLNQTSMRKIMTYSSINHMAWMLMSMIMNQSIWIIYFLIYSIITINIIQFLKINNIYFIKQLNNSMNSNKLMKTFFMMNFLSLSGLPPFIGFLPKWLTINFMINTNMIIMSILLIIFTLISLYIYIRISQSTLILNNYEMINKQIYLNKKNWMIYNFNLINLSLLLICPIIFMFM